MLAALALAPACAATDTGGDDDDDVLPDTAYLTIVGDRDVFLENGWTYRLSVRYHDAAGEPLAGRVDFRIVGPAAGASLLDDGGVTNGDGLVAVDLVAGAQGEAVFTVEATAANAEPAIWNIAVSEGVPPLPPLDVTGTYDVDNHFDIVSGLPGTAGDIVNTFIELTDDPYDPATFLLDKLQDEIDSGVINDLVDAARPALDGFLNDLIRSYSPDFVSTLLDIGDKLGQVTRNLGLESTLKIEIVGGVEGDDLSATHTVRGVTFRIDGVEYAYSMADLSMDDITVEGVGVRMDGETKVYIDEHSFPVSYGAIAMLALDEVIIPLVDSSATNLQELLSHLVDCYTVGVEIANYIGVGSPGLYEGACELGIAAAASEIENQIRSIDDAGIVLTIHGDAKPQDTNTDRKVDVLLNGRWEGTISYAGTDAALSRDDNTFRGERMPVP
ncbi:MAG: hypothetical protein D6689_20315 [Deltaproteobacteria bacterium]|nr:MAG: hypothetical protein D6689_20315 [Deltaproteobacteria bacterium]